jgi:hypothetical protein
MTKVDAKKEIKKHLWGWDFKVQDTRGMADYDMRVNGNVRIKVVVSTFKDATQKRITSGCDVLAVYIMGKCPIANKRRMYSRGEDAGNGMKKFENYFNVPNEVIRGARTP